MQKSGSGREGCLSGYELRNIYCENAKKSRRGGPGPGGRGIEVIVKIKLL